MNTVVATATNKYKKYSIILDNKIIEDASRINHERAKKALIITTPTVQNTYGNFIDSVSKQFEESTIIVLTSFECNKNFSMVEYLCQRAVIAGLGRKDVFIAISGGCCNDVVTTAAGLYKRGVDVIRIPTTLIGAVDAGIGIKSSLNWDEHKSSFGLYHPPHSVHIDCNFIATLPKNHILCGVSEMIKMGIISDKKLFDDIDKNSYEISKQSFYKDISKNGNEIIKTSIQRMIDELETNFYEDRTYKRLVDFGHTFSNSLEPASNWVIPHGYAVAIDMALSSYIANEMGLISSGELDRILSLFLNVGLPIYSDFLTTKVCFEALEKAEMHRAGNINLVIPNSIGKGTFIENTSDQLKTNIKKGLNYLSELQNNFCNENAQEIA